MPIKSKQTELELAPQRKIYEIAQEIVDHWDNVYFGAKPYLEAMFSLSSINNQYGCDTGRSIIAYFLSNATYWRGPVARRIKKELNAMLKETRMRGSSSHTQVQY